MPKNSKVKDDREKSIDIAISSIEKQFGKGSIMRLGADTPALSLSVISTGSLGMDIALGVGGLPRGRIVEIYGEESTGKTTITLHSIAEAQKAGGIAAFVDVEHALDAVYARNLGVKVDDLLVSQPESGEEALEIVDSLLRSGAVDTIVLDSVAALTPRAEIEGDMGAAHVGLQARLMSQALRKMTATINKSKTVVIFTNQTRMRIESRPIYGNPTTTPGGKALKFSASVRMEVKKIASLKDGDKILANRVRVKVTKNKVAPPFREAELDLIFGKGISQLSELVDLGIKYKVLDRSGTWVSYKDEKLGQGKENAKNFLIENPEIRKEIYFKILEESGVPNRNGRLGQSNG